MAKTLAQIRLEQHYIGYAFCLHFHILFYSINQKGPYFGADQYAMTTKGYSLPNGELFSDGYHNWTLDWTPEGFNCSLDGNLYFTISTENGYWEKGAFNTNKPGSHNPWQFGEKDAPFDHKFFFILNVAAGGTNGYFPTGSVSSPNGFPSYSSEFIYASCHVEPRECIQVSRGRMSLKQHSKTFGVR